MERGRVRLGRLSRRKLDEDIKRDPCPVKTDHDDRNCRIRMSEVELSDKTTGGRGGGLCGEGEGTIRRS